MDCGSILAHGFAGIAARLLNCPLLGVSASNRLLLSANSVAEFLLLGCNMSCNVSMLQDLLPPPGLVAEA